MGTFRISQRPILQYDLMSMAQSLNKFCLNLPCLNIWCQSEERDYGILDIACLFMYSTEHFFTRWVMSVKHCSYSRKCASTSWGSSIRNERRFHVNWVDLAGSAFLPGINGTGELLQYPYALACLPLEWVLASDSEIIWLDDSFPSVALWRTGPLQSGTSGTEVSAPCLCSRIWAPVVGWQLQSATSS